MRVDGPGTATDFLPSKTETNSSAAVKGVSVQETADKLRMDNLLPHKARMEEVQEAVDVLNKAMRISDHRLEFQLHEGSGRYQVKVVDTISEEVIKEIPPDYLLDFSARVRETLDEILGILVDEFV